MIIDFFVKNLNFANHGFYKGFGEMLFNMVVSEKRAVSDQWLVSVLIKIASLGVTDPDYRRRVQNLLGANCERFTSNALIKFVVLELALNQGQFLLKQKDMILRRLKGFNLDGLHDIRMIT